MVPRRQTNVYQIRDCGSASVAEQSVYCRWRLCDSTSSAKRKLWIIDMHYNSVFRRLLHSNMLFPALCCLCACSSKFCKPSCKKHRSGYTRSRHFEIWNHKKNCIGREHCPLPKPLPMWGASPPRTPPPRRLGGAWSLSGAFSFLEFWLGPWLERPLWIFV